MTVNPAATEEEIEKAIKSGEADQIFVQETINRKEAAEAALRYIKVLLSLPLKVVDQFFGMTSYSLNFDLLDTFHRGRINTMKL
jgi:hypothetical protein